MLAVRIAVDCRYVRERPSGIGEYVRALVDRLPELAPDDRFRLWVDPRAARPLSDSPNVDERLVSAPANGVRTLLCPALLAGFDDIDVFHAPFNILGRGIRTATVVTIHDLLWLLSPALSEGCSLLTPFKVLFYRLGILRALRRATRLVAISHATADSIHRVLPAARSRVRVIPHGVKPRFRPPVSSESVQRALKAQLGLECPYLLLVGQNAPSKNHLAVLEAFAASRLPDELRLVLLHRLYQSRGFGSRGALADHARRLGIGSRVVFLPRASDEQVVKLLQGALALIQFSRFEGFGMPALEAMACGTPVVASDIPALVEVLGGAGLHVPLRVDALARALERVVRDGGLRAELSGRGVARSAAFSWQRSAELHLELYREAVERP